MSDGESETGLEEGEVCDVKRDRDLRRKDVKIVMDDGSWMMVKHKNRHSPSSPLPRNMPTTSSPSHPGLVLPAPNRPPPLGTAILPRDSGRTGDRPADGPIDPAAVCGRRLPLPPGKKDFDPKLGALDGSPKAAVVDDSVESGSSCILSIFSFGFGEACTVSSFGDLLCVPAPIPGARLNLLPATTTLSISGVSSADVAGDREAGVRALNDLREGIVLPLCRETKGDGRGGAILFAAMG